MASKVTSSLTLKTLIPDIKKSFLSNATTKRAIREEVIAHINEGNSPVRGEKFLPYSDKYAELKGKKSPVDMLVTGKMLRSLQIRRTKSSFLLSFRNKVAKFHNETGRVIRRLLPTKRGERFSNTIEELILNAVEKARDIAVKNQNR